MFFTNCIKKLPEKLYDFAPYPAACSRSEWKLLDADMCASVVTEAETYVDYRFLPLSATLYMDFSRTGNRSRFEETYFSRRTVLNVLVLAECIEYKSRFTDSIINGICALCEESGWQLPAHNSYVRDTPQLPLPDPEHPVLDLFACETGCQLAMIHYLLHTELDAVCPEICLRIEKELNHRIFKPYMTEKFWWMGYDGERTNNWTTWCTQNVLIAVFLPGVLCDSEKNTVDTVRHFCLRRSAYSMDRFLAEYGEDGCCDEGAQYYRHAGLCLFNVMEILDTVGGGGICSELYRKNKIRNIAEYIVNVHVSDNYYINFSDCAAVAGRAGVREFLFGKRCGSTALMSYAAEDWRQSRPWQSDQSDSNQSDKLNLFYLVQELFTVPEIDAFPVKRIQSAPDISYKSTGLFISRDSTYCLAVKAGNNDDSHNHNDTGSFILYKNGMPFIIDIGVETYSSRTFSPRRYEIWTMQSFYHNVTNFGSIMQAAGSEYCAEKVRYRHSKKKMHVSMELLHAYPPICGVDSYFRSVTFEKEKYITITDTVSGHYTEAVFTLVTQGKPVVSVWGASPEITIKELGTVRFESPSSVQIKIEPIPLTDPQLLQSWSDTIYRILVGYCERLTAVFQ